MSPIYSGSGGDETATGAEPDLSRWADYRRTLRWTDPGAAWGNHVGAYEGLRSTNCHARTILVPVGQASEPTLSPGIVFMLVLNGAIEVRTDENSVVAERHDIVRLKPDVKHSYGNCGLGDALLTRFDVEPREPIPGLALPVSDEPLVHMDAASRRNFRWTHLTWGDRWGYHRGTAPLEGWAHAAGHLVRQPVGQSSPWHSSAAEIFFLQLAGEVEFTACGQRWLLQPLDLFRMPGDAPYTYTNVGSEEVWFYDLVIRERSDDPTYYAGDPGWPIRSDAKLLDVS